MHPESGNSINSGPLATPTRTTNLSRRLSSSNQLSGLLATPISKDYRLNADYNADSDHARVTMKTRVAVRDKAPHRFQVVPLHDVSKLAALEAGRPSHLALPLASHTLLRSASIRRQTYSQVRPIIASSYSQLDIDSPLADSETLAASCAEMLPIPALALSPSFELDNLGGSHALAEQDMNRQCTKSTTNKFESSATVTIPTTAFQSYDASYHTHVQNPAALFSDRNPSIHTTSQSLDLAPRNSGTYSEISRKGIPEHLFEPIQSSIMNSKSPRNKRTRSENIPRIRDNNQRAGRNGPAATATKDNYDSRVTKRHAIYTQSLYVPFFELPDCFPGSLKENQTGCHQFFGDHPNGNVVSRFSDFVSDSGATLHNTDQSSPSTRCVLPDLLEAAPSEKPLQVLTLKPLASVPHNGPHRGLRYYRLSRVYPLSAEARLHIVYPQIVREMFADIDSAIHEWKHV